MLGANHSLLLLLRYLKHKEDVHITVLVPNEGSFTTKLNEIEIPYKIIPFHFSYHTDNLNWKGRFLKLIDHSDDLIRIITKRKIFQDVDIIYSNSSVISHGLILSKVLKKKHIWHIREYGLEDYNLKPILGKNIQKSLFRKSDKLVFISYDLKNRRKSWYKDPNNTNVIYNGVEIMDAHYLPRKEFNSKSIKACFAGLMSEKKNAIEGLVLLELLRNENIKMKYHIFSNMTGAYSEEFIKNVEERGLKEYVQFHGFVNNLMDAIKGLDFLLMPSRNEAMGRVSIEAMSVGVPVIGYNGGGTSELFEDMVSGIYYNSIAEAVEKIKKIDTQQYMKMSEAARRTAIESFNMEKYGEEVYKVCSELMKLK